MDSVLVCELAVVIDGCMQRHMGVGHVVADVCRQVKDSIKVFGFECFCESVKHGLHVVGYDAIGEQGVCRVFFYCLFPEFGNGIDGHGFFIAFQIDVMSAGLGGICVSPLIGIYGVFREEIDVRFIEFEQGLRQGENGLFVDGFMSQKSPSLQVMNREQQK